MHLTRLKISNLRAIEALDVAFDTSAGRPRRRVVLVGANGVGKTTVLDAVVHAFSAGAGAERYGGARLKTSDVRSVGREGPPVVATPLPVAEIELHLELTDNDVAFSFATLGAPGPRSSLAQFRIGGQKVGDGGLAAAVPVSEDKLTTTPFSMNAVPPERPACLYLPASRGVLRLADTVSLEAINSFHPQRNALSADEKRFESLAALLGLAYLQRDQGTPTSNAIDRMWRALERFDDLPKPALIRGIELQFQCDDRSIVPLRALSHGQRALLLIFAEIAVRRPDGGIVLIDEIEQHLHPRWQRLIMEALTALSPTSQFIVTTQSPIFATANANDLVTLGDWDKHG